MNSGDEDVAFIKKFYGLLALRKKWRGNTALHITVRLRLDKLIQKIKISLDVANEPYVALIKRRVFNNNVNFGTAKILISEYKN